MRSIIIVLAAVISLLGVKMCIAQQCNCATGLSCCVQSSGPACYSTSQYECINGNTLCPAGYSVCESTQQCYDPTVFTCFPSGIECLVGEQNCGPSCYLPSQYYCVDSELQQRGVGVYDAEVSSFTSVPSTAQSSSPSTLSVSNNGLQLADGDSTTISSWWYPYLVWVSNETTLSFDWIWEPREGQNYNENPPARNFITLVVQTQSNTLLPAAAQHDTDFNINNALYIIAAEEEVIVINSDGSANFEQSVVAFDYEPNQIWEVSVAPATYVYVGHPNWDVVIIDGDDLSVFINTPFKYIGSSTPTLAFVGVVSQSDENVWLNSFSVCTPS